jgi:hypothetical protein
VVDTGYVDSNAASIPDLERLIRGVLRRCFVGKLGSSWLTTRSQRVRDAVAKAAGLARTQRPDEELLDDWDAAGLGEISVAVSSSWSEIGGSIKPVWSSQQAAIVDLERLQAYRGKTLHAVGPPVGQIRAAEVDAIVLRIRVAFEQIRRTLINDEGDWWPYIEAIHSNISEFCLTRNARTFGAAALMEGDLVTFNVVGVHPTGSQDALVYRLNHAGPGASSADDTDWRASPQFQVVVPRARSVAYHLFVADANDTTNNDEWVCSCEIRPR